MKISEAIDNLKADLLRPGSVDKLDFQDAEQLGIEALKDYQKLKLTTFLPPGYKLPGETE
ncbi:hypothetical protein ES708_29072 [subsurface metagenome]